MTIIIIMIIMIIIMIVIAMFIILSIHVDSVEHDEVWVVSHSDRLRGIAECIEIPEDRSLVPLLVSIFSLIYFAKNYWLVIIFRKNADKGCRIARIDVLSSTCKY